MALKRKLSENCGPHGPGRKGTLGGRGVGGVGIDVCMHHWCPVQSELLSQFYIDSQYPSIPRRNIKGIFVLWWFSQINLLNLGGGKETKPVWRQINKSLVLLISIFNIIYHLFDITVYILPFKFSVKPVVIVRLGVKWGLAVCFRGKWALI